MTLRKVLPLLAVFLLLCPHAKPQTGPPPTGQPSTGKRIGQIIVDAIGVASPAVGDLIKTLFPPGKKTVDQATVTKIATDQIDSSTQKAKEGVAQASAVSAELGVVGRFLQSSVPASQRVSRILLRLDQPITGSLSAAIASDWSSLQTSLKNLGNITDGEINKVSDSGLRLQLIQVRNIDSGSIDDIKSSIEGGRVEDVKNQLRAVQTLLNSVVSVVGIEIVNLQNDVDVAVLWAKGTKPMGVVNTDPRIKIFNATFDSDMLAATRVLRKRAAGQ